MYIIVSEEKGTTTDPIYKAMEVHGLGPVVFIDTAGLVVFLMTSLFAVKLPRPLVFIKGALVTGLPGILIQLILIPSAVYLLRKTKYIK